MNPTAILWPVGALALLTFAVLLVVPYRRFRAGFARQVRVEAARRVNVYALREGK